VHANERVLDRFLGIFARAEHLHRESQRPRVVTLHQQGEACAIALLCVAENIPVERLHGCGWKRCYRRTGVMCTAPDGVSVPSAARV
jgi:hypothetical protein